MKTIFKIFAVLYLFNILNIVISIVLGIYSIFGFNVNMSLLDLFTFSIVMIFPLTMVLIYFLSNPIKPIKLWKLSLK